MLVPFFYNLASVLWSINAGIQNGYIDWSACFHTVINGGGDSIGNKGMDEVVSANGGTQDTVTGESSAAVAAEHAVRTLEGGEGGIAKEVGDGGIPPL